MDYPAREKGQRWRCTFTNEFGLYIWEATLLKRGGVYEPGWSLEDIVVVTEPPPPAPPCGAMSCGDFCWESTFFKMELLAPAPYEAPKLTPTSIETATGSELDVLAEAVYGLKRRSPARPGWPAEPDCTLRARCLDLRRQLRAMPGADLLPDHIIGIDIAAGDTWFDPEGRRLFVHSYIAEIRAWNVVVNDAQITTTMFATEIHRRGESTLFHRTDQDKAEPVKQPAAEPTACDACGEIPPGGNHAAHACVALASAILVYEDQLAWLAKREAEIGRCVACCTIGGVHWMAAKPCPIHEKPRAPAPWAPGWDAFDFKT